MVFGKRQFQPGTAIFFCHDPYRGYPSILPVCVQEESAFGPERGKGNVLPGGRYGRHDLDKASITLQKHLLQPCGESKVSLEGKWPVNEIGQAGFGLVAIEMKAVRRAEGFCKCGKRCSRAFPVLCPCLEICQPDIRVAAPPGWPDT